jgi:hypothetical protein
MVYIMKLTNIILGVVVIIVLYVAYSYFFASSTSSSPSGILDARGMHVVAANSLPSNTSTNYGYSIWFYVDDWSHNLGQQKVIFDRGAGSKKGSVGSPSVAFDAVENNITVSIATTGDAPGDSNTNTCTIQNVPLQAWTNLIVTLNSRALDIYVDGKLVKTCLLSNPPRLDSGSSVRITPGGGFSGYTSRFQYFPAPLSPQEAYNIYKSGYGGDTGLGALASKYRIKVGFLEHNQEVNSFEI